MKITRNKSGYRIALTDTEFEVLSGLVSDGIMTMEGDEMARDHWSPAEKATFTRWVNARGGEHCIMSVDEDRRKKP